MTMKKSILLFALAALALTACQEEIAPEGNHETPTVDQTTDSAEPQVKDYPLELNFVTPNMVDGKTTLVDGTKVNWVADDMIKVFWAEGKSNPAKAVISDDASTATFSVQVEEADAYYAVYPYTDRENLSGDVITVEVPSVQGGTFADANIMLAKADANNNLPFKHLVGLLEFEVDMAGTVEISGASDDVLAGNVKISDFAEDGTPEYSVENGAKTVNIKVEQAGTYYAALLPSAKLNCVSIKVTTTDGESQNTEYALSANSIQLSRGALIPLGNVTSCLGKHFFVKADADGSGDGKTWETAFTYQQVADLVAANRSAVSGVAGTNTDIAETGFAPEDMTADAYRELHNTEHAAQVNGVTFHFAAGTYSSSAYVRISYPERGEAVKISFKGGYPATSKGTDLNNRDSETNVTTIDGQSTKRLFFPRYYTDLAFDGITFANGKVNTGGGAFLFNESQTSSLTFRNCKFTNNVTTNNGSTKYSGGAILAKNGSGKINLENCEFTGNSSEDVGGAINIEGNGELTITGGIFKDNSAGSNAGAINVNCNVFSADGVTFENNTCAPTAAGNAQGGAIYFATNANYKERTLTNCVFTGNSVSAANAVYESSGTKNYVRGGAIYVSGLPKVTIIGGSFTGNSQKDYGTYKMYGGGAIFSISEVALSGVTFSGNSAYYGGALNFSGLTTCTRCVFKGNSAVYGGALNGIASSTAVFTECEVSENETINNGGAAWLNPVKSVTFDRCTFKKNKVTENNMGGVFYFSGTSSLKLLGGVYEGNSAGKSGGVIYCSGSNAEITITDTQFKDNEARSADGGVIWNSGAGAKVNIGGNASFTGNKAAVDGGVFRTTVNSTWTINGTVTFADNTAAKQGGVFCSERPSSDKAHPAPTVNITGASFNNNKANGGEAGAIIFYGGDWTLSGCSLVGNSATSNGGAIYSNTGKLSVRNTLFSGNSTPTTGVGGGAIYVTTNSVIDIDGSEFIGNKAPNMNGGAINIASTAKGLHKINNSYFEGNGAIEAGALWTAAGGTLYLNGCSFYGNKPTKKNTGGVVKIASLSFINNCSFVDNSGADWESSLIITGTTTLLNSTLIEKSSATLSAPMNTIRLYGASAVGNIYNNVILSASRSLAAAYGANPGSVESKGYNYTGAWSTQGDGSVTASATTISTDNVVTPKDVFGSFAYPSSSAFHKYYTWTIPDGKSQTTLADMTTFLNGVEGGTAFVEWLGSVNGLSHDIAGNARPATGVIYPGCYQKN